MDDRYCCFDELAAHEKEGVDFRVSQTIRDSAVLVIAIHGGKIEPGTGEIAAAIAGGEFSLYAFEGIKPKANHVLHIGSHRFDEPRLLRMIGNARTVVSVHGQGSEKEAFVMVGGRGTDWTRKVEGCLKKAGFETRMPDSGLGANDPSNVCNRAERGVQLEISRALRENLKNAAEDLQAFAAAVREAIGASRVQSEAGKR